MKKTTNYKTIMIDGKWYQLVPITKGKLKSESLDLLSELSSAELPEIELTRKRPTLG